MFTGIVEQTAVVKKIEKDGSNYHFTLQTPIARELKIDQSMAHNGVCLTVVKIDRTQNLYTVTAMDETMQRTNLGCWKEGTEVNLERSMKMDGRFDGHIVQGHVDTTAVCCKKETLDGSWKFHFKFNTGNREHFTVEKGSICVNGVSLTVVDSKPGEFSVAIIPYTFENTNFHNFEEGTVVNLEFDVFGKYVARLLQQYMAAKE